MTRHHLIWIALAGLYAAFFAWHQPLKGPLTQDEIENYLQERDAGTAPDFASAQAFRSFLEADDGRPFFMVNLIELRPQAAYPEGYATDITSAADADTEYGRNVVQLLIRRGSYPLLQLTPHTVLLDSVGGQADQFEHAVVVRYRSRRDLMDMVTSDAFKAAEVHKWASVERTLVAPSASMGATPLGLIVPFVLLLSGFVLTRRRRLFD